LQRPEKTSRNSSKPPSSDRKERRENAKPGGAKPGHEGHARGLSENPDAFEDHAPTHCPRCGLPFGECAERKPIGEYDEIELPPIRPFVRRHRRFSIRCACCGKTTAAPVPDAAQGTPFGPRIHALAVYLNGMQLFSYERLSAALIDLFGLTVSEGALLNMFKRTKTAFEARRAETLAALRRARFVSCDETGARIEGVNSRRLRSSRPAFHWVFCSKVAVVHGAAFTRAAEVVRDAMAGHRPTVWTSDRYSARAKVTPTGRRPVLRISIARPASSTRTARTRRRSACACGSTGSSPWPATSRPSPPRPCAPSAAPWSAIATPS
jgi:transposase